MSEMGQSRRFAPWLTTSSLPPTADVTHRDHHFRFVPKADLGVALLNVRFRRRVRPIAATHSANFSAGV